MDDRSLLIVDRSIRNLDRRLRDVDNREVDKYIIPVGRRGDLQAALDRANNNGGGTVVLSPNTTYIAEDTFTIGNFTTLRGSGGSVLQRHPSLTSHVLRNKGYVLGIGWGTQNNQIVIRDLAIDGLNGGQGAWVDGHDLIMLSACYDSLIENVMGYNALNDGIILEFCSTTAVSKCRMSAARKAGIYLAGCDRCDVDLCSSQVNGLCGFEFAYSWNCTLDNCVSFGSLTNAGVITGRGTRYCEFTNCRISGFVVSGEALGVTALLGPNEAARQDNPYVRDGTTYYGMDDCIIDHCHITRNEVSSGVSLYLSSRNKLLNSIIAYNFGYGCVISGGSDNKVADNDFVANCMGGTVIWAMAAFQADAGAGVPATVYSTGNRFDHNDVYDPQGVPTQIGGLLFTPALSVDNIARRNRVKNAPYAGIFAAISLLEENIGLNVPVQALVAGTTIHPYGKIVPIDSVGNITLTSVPTVTNGYYDGQRITLHNTGANTITLQDQVTLGGSNLRLTATGVTLGPRDCVDLTYSAATGDWAQSGNLVANI